MKEKESEDEPLKILLCDDDPGFRKLVRTYLRSSEDRKFLLTEAGRKEEIQEALDKGGFDLILMDVLMPDKSGMEWLIEIVAKQLAPVVMLTGFGSEELAVQSLHEGAIDYIPKDHLTKDSLWGSVKAALETWKLKQVERLQYVLYQIADAANRTKDLEELFLSIHRYLSTVIDTTNFYIALRDREKDALTIPYFIAEKDKFTSFIEGKTLTSYVMKKGEPFLATEGVIEDLVQSGEVEQIGTQPKVWLGAPLKIREKVVGALCVQSYEKTSIYSKNDLDILKFVSGQIAIVIERKRAEEELKAHREHIKLINKILRHDIINDLSVISSALSLYEESKNEEFLEAASARVNKSVELINRMRELETFISSHRDLKLYTVTDVLKQVIECYPAITFSIEGKCQVLADESLNSVIDNIIHNAVVHGKTDRIDIKIGEREKCCEIRIADYGAGIPDEIKEKIFGENFIYGETGGTGLGMYIARKAVESFGGHVYVEDNKPRGAVFVLKLRGVT